MISGADVSMRAFELQNMGGATVVKVGGAILRAERAKKKLTPTFWPVGGQNIAYIAKSA